jgi:arylsulfatase A-like enzyme
MPSAGKRPPDVVVVLFDCLRARDFPGGPEPVTGMPFTESLLRESILFPRAISPAPWTIPSHAGLFTGAYPWENHVNALHSLNLDPSIPTLPEVLRPLGYRSLSLSANPFISPRFGLVRGFDVSAWGGWWEAFLRSPRDRAPNRQEGGAAGPADDHDRLMEWVRDGPMGDLLRSASQQSFRFPSVLDAGSQVVQKVRFPDRERNISHTPWIEHELTRWLERQSPETPTFTFINLTDTHEPYYPDPTLVHGFREWWRLTRGRQDYANAAGGDWRPRPDESSRLRELYRQMIHHLDVRLKGIVGAYESSGRWDQTLCFVTSDHGQSLGEHGMMFHLLRLDESLLRIPLWMRPPAGDGGGRRAVGWANLVDLFPTIVEHAGGFAPNTSSALPLDRLVDRERPEPVYAMADGIVWDHIRERFRSKEREAVWDRPWVAGYQGDLKVVMTADGQEIHAYDVTQDTAEVHDLWPSSAAPLVGLAGETQRVGTALLQSGGKWRDPEIEDRLRSWGYV